MPSFQAAHSRHAALYFLTVEKADRNFSKESTKVRGISIFDQNRDQIECALDWIIHQKSTEQTDILLARFIDALSNVGMIRYNVREKLIPLSEQKIAAAQRLGFKDLEADSIDGLGILYAYLGYLPQALSYFDSAYKIAHQIGDKKLKRNVHLHIRKAQRQLKNKIKSPSATILNLLRLLLFQLRLFFANITKNPFAKIAMHNGIANIYLDFGKKELAIRNYQQAVLLSKKHSFRLGELEASMGLLQVAVMKGVLNDETLTLNTISDLASDFEWSTDFSVYEILLEIAPTIGEVEAIAGQLAQSDDPRAIEIYKLLDQIMIRTDEIILAVSESPKQKHEIFLSALESIKDSLARIVEMSSN